MRPDGIRAGRDVIDHKHITESAGGQVLHDSPQLRGERAMAISRGGQHEIVLSSESGTRLRNNPPQPRPSTTVGSTSLVYFFDPAANSGAGAITHRWDPATNTWREL